MARFPEPPAVERLQAIGPAVRQIPKGATIWRVYFQAGAHPTTWKQFRAWGPTQSRFDHHLLPASMQSRAILYGAVGPHAAVTSIAETFQATRIVERAARAPAWVAFATTRKLALLDLTGAWPTRAGASMAMATGRRDRARRWSQALYEAFPDLDGLFYPSSMHANRPCVALYERAEPALPRRPLFHRQLSDPSLLTLLRNVCADVGYGLL